jgi:hypothetical protein
MTDKDISLVRITESEWVEVARNERRKIKYEAYTPPNWIQPAQVIDCKISIDAFREKTCPSPGT